MHRITPEELESIKAEIMRNRSSPDYEGIAKRAGRSVLTIKRIARVIRQNAIQYRTKAQIQPSGHYVPQWEGKEGPRPCQMALEALGL